MEEEPDAVPVGDLVRLPIDGDVSDGLPRDITAFRDSGGFFHTGAVGGGTLPGGAQSDAEEDGAVQQDAEVVEAPFEDCAGGEEGEYGSGACLGMRRAEYQATCSASSMAMSENSTKGEMATRSWMLVAILQKWVSSMWSWLKTAKEGREGFWLQVSNLLFRTGCLRVLTDSLVCSRGFIVMPGPHRSVGLPSVIEAHVSMQNKVYQSFLRTSTLEVIAFSDCSRWGLIASAIRKAAPVMACASFGWSMSCK